MKDDMDLPGMWSHADFEGGETDNANVEGVEGVVEKRAAAERANAAIDKEMYWDSLAKEPRGHA